MLREALVLYDVVLHEIIPQYGMLIAWKDVE